MNHEQFLNQEMAVDIRRRSNNCQVNSGNFTRKQVNILLDTCEESKADLTGTIFHMDGSITIRYQLINGVEYAGRAIPIKPPKVIGTLDFNTGTITPTN